MVFLMYLLKAVKAILAGVSAPLLVDFFKWVRAARIC